MKNVLNGKQVLVIGAIGLLLLSFLLIGYLIDFAEQFNQQRLTSFLTSAGPLAPLVLILTMAVAVVVSPIPSLPLDLAAGAVFGPLWGTTYAVIGAEIGAILSFLIGRALGRELLAKLLRTDVVFCEKCSDHHLMVLLVLARLVPVFSFDVISYGAGLTNVSLKVFALATLVGMIPPTFALTYLGSSVMAIQWPMILAGVVMVAIFLLTPKLVQRYPAAWWAQLLLVAKPAPAPIPDKRPETPVQEMSAGLPKACSGCGASLKQ